jgi:DNA repair exonuclease SbcCD ATPase subunit
MQIVKIVAENFLSFERFELELADRGLLCIEGENADMGGSNGSGKSSIFEALIWCFFGVTSRGIKAGEVVRRDSKNQPVGNTAVIVQVDLDGTDLLVARHRDHKKYGNKMLLVANGQELTMGGDKETQQRLQQMLQIDYGSFVSAVMFPQGAAGFAGLADAEQKAILERVLAVGRFADAQRVVKDRLSLLSTKERDIGATIAQRSAVQVSSRQAITALREKSDQFLVTKQQTIDRLVASCNTEEAKVIPRDPTLPIRLQSLNELSSAIDGKVLWNAVLQCNEEHMQANRAEAQAKAAKLAYESVLAAAAPTPVADPGVTCQDAAKRTQTLGKAVANTRAHAAQCENAIS